LVFQNYLKSQGNPVDISLKGVCFPKNDCGCRDLEEYSVHLEIGEMIVIFLANHLKLPVFTLNPACCVKSFFLA
jgi:hypothetical protein